jgi:predicted ATPase
MNFIVRSEYPLRKNIEPGTFVLVADKWDDYFKFSTLYALYIVDENEELQEVGNLKIGQFNMERKQRSPELPKRFEQLDERFFSLGQDDEYYLRLNDLGDATREEILRALNDIAKNEQLYEKAKNEKVSIDSLFRFAPETTVKIQFRRMANGGARLSRYDFIYHSPSGKNSAIPQISLDFHVVPDSNPPTNIHVLIGKNGVGKTYLLNNMAAALVEDNAIPSRVGYFESAGRRQRSPEELFSGLVSVTFSAFDESNPPLDTETPKGIKYYYIGLKRPKEEGQRAQSIPKTPAMLKTEFVESVVACLASGRKERWRNALEMLETDQLFNEYNISSLADIKRGREMRQMAGELFNQLSSGHKIVLLTITRLIETVEERTLVLIDEPESHLHPPLLSAFIRVLSNLLVLRNGVAIIATHSPVVLQEVPRSCVYNILRIGEQTIAQELELESFGENVGSLTSAVFGLEVTHSGFHKLLRKEVVDWGDFDIIMARFGNQLGTEARAILRSLVLTQDRQS